MIERVSAAGSTSAVPAPGRAGREHARIAGLTAPLEGRRTRMLALDEAREPAIGGQPLPPRMTCLRISRGDAPNQALAAREKALSSENPSRKAISVKGSSVSLT